MVVIVVEFVVEVIGVWVVVVVIGGGFGCFICFIGVVAYDVCLVTGWVFVGFC